MAFWNRRNKVATEVSDYYRSTDAVSRPTAFLLSLFAFVVVFVIVFSAILGSRWAWNKIRDNRNENTELVVDDNSNSSNAAQNSSSNSETNSQNGTTIVGSGESTNTPNSPSSQNSTTNTASNVSVPTTVTNTGPASNMAIILGVSTVATLAHKRWSTKKN